MQHAEEIEIDFETRSPVDLKTCGAYVYFEHAETRVMIASYSIDGSDDIRRWEFPQPMPEDLKEAVLSGRIVKAHNANFEIQCFRWLAKNLGWILPPVSQFRCTAARAAAMGLPRALDKLAKALGLAEQKDKEGMRLIRKFSVPRKATKDEKAKGLDVSDHIFWNEPEDHPEDWQKFKEYCDQDVRTEAAADRRMVPLSDFEQEVWVMDQKINDRGLRIDRTSAAAALRLADEAKALLDREMRQVTRGAVGKCSEPAKLLAWVTEQGIELSSAAKADITEALSMVDLPADVRRALELRQEAAKTSVQKIAAMLKRASADGRVRGSFIYHKAGPGRWASVGVNFANMPRPRRCFEDAALATSVLYDAIRLGSPDWLIEMYGEELGSPLHLLADTVRGYVWAGAGNDLVQADYSGIEGAVAAWLADETWKLKAMFDIIKDKTIPDMYRQTAAAIMNMSTDVIDKKHFLRQAVGKTSELALGFGGGVSAFYTMALTYGVDLEMIYEPVWGAADLETREKAVKRYNRCFKLGTDRTAELSRNAWIACEIVKVGWRKSNSAIAAAWGACEQAIREAIANPGSIVSVLKLKYTVAKGFLWCQLPSGRTLGYASPRLKNQVWAIKFDPNEGEGGFGGEAEVMDEEEALKLEAKGLVRIQGKTSPSISFLGEDATTGRWQRQHMYGGLAFQNAVQAIARDLLVNGMILAEKNDFPIIGHVYDEMICEVPRGSKNISDFEELICRLPPWAAGMPLTAGGWIGKRYRKD